MAQELQIRDGYEMTFTQLTERILGCYRSSGSLGDMEAFRQLAHLLDEKLAESRETIAALVSDYVAVYRIEPASDRASALKISEAAAEAVGGIPQGFCYSAAFNTYAQTHICAEDRQNFLQIVRPDALLSTFSDGRKLFEINYRAQMKDGSQVHYSGQFIRVSAPGEELCLVAGFRCVEDIVNVQKQAQAQLTEQSAVFSALARNFKNVYRVNLSTGRARVLKLETDYIRVPPQDANGEFAYTDLIDPWIDRLVYPADCAELRHALSIDNMRSQLAQHGEYTGNYRSIAMGGVHYFQYNVLKTDTDMDTAIVAFQNVDDIIAEHLAAEREKQQQEHARQKRMAEQMAIIDTLSQNYRNVFIANLRDGTAKAIRLADSYRVKSVRDVENEAFPFDVVVDRWSRETVHPDDSERIRTTLSIDNLRKTLAKQDNMVGTYRNIEDGVQHYYQYDFRRIAGTENAVAGFQIIDDIVAEQTAYQRELIAARDAAEQASRAKTEFLLRMSHDIRTPINGIMGMLDIADKNADDLAKQADCRAKIRAASDILLDLINEVLDTSKLESGEVKLEHVPFNLVDVSTEVFNAIQKQAADRDIEIVQEGCSAEYAHLVGSPLHLKRLMMNIVSNAVKYNKDHGKIYITCREFDACGDRVKLQFKCRDTGIGMSEQFLAHIFEPFAQENSSARTRYAGTGLGMSIVKKLVDRMGGTITVESTKGEGSTFDVILPFDIDRTAPAARTPAQDTAPADIQGVKVLLAEDNELNMEIAKFLLEDAGAHVTAAWNGKEALDAYLASAPGSFDVVLMDIMMPVMDGYEATRAIRAAARPDARTIPIIAMTANAFVEDRLASQKAGMNAHLAKPLDAKLIVKTIAALVPADKRSV